MKFESILHKLVGVLFSIMFFSLLFLCITSQDVILLRDEITLIIFGLIFCVVSYWILNHIPSVPKSNNLLFHILLVLSLVQCYSIYLYYFYTDWDPWSIIDAAYFVARGEPIGEWLVPYFSRYPNNAVMLMVYSYILRFFMLFQNEEQAYFGILIFQCILSFVTELLLYHTASKLFSKRLGAFVVLLYTLMVSISPWLSIPYSDALTLIFPVSIFALYNWESPTLFKRIVKWMLIGSVGYLGFRIKPQCIIIVIAIVLVEGIHFISKLISKNHSSTFAIGGGSFCVGVIVSMLLLNYAVGQLPMETNPEAAFGMPHFFMMGLNEEKRGRWAAEDVEFSDSFSTKEERNRNDWIRSGERIRQMGVSGLCKQVKEKMLSTYDDGTFSWGGEGTFYRVLLEKEDTRYSLFLKSLFYEDNIYQNDYSSTGGLYWVWRTMSQGLWLTILALGMFSVKSMWDSSDKLRRRICVLLASVIGLTLFEALFECRARYLFHYLPIYIFLAAVGLKNISDIWSAFNAKHRKKPV